ncbi:hypothetical protein L195_g049862 [Trifolium pratense]|uniref:Uncharacterized protein n=1 Tax=Trifolium pratense TaxID=57577 RepID=A0A2K3JQU4_TRIPR|nr:hypothetical protein L195_g049862 [Trifolium pratense]
MLSLLSVEEAVSIDELLGYVQDGATTNSVQPSPIANQEPSGLSCVDLNAPPASTALPIAGNVMPGFDLNAPPASTALPTCFTSLHLSGSQGNRLSQVATSMETNLGSSEIEVQAAEDFVQSAINIPSEDFGQRKV